MLNNAISLTSKASTFMPNKLDGLDQLRVKPAGKFTVSEGPHSYGQPANNIGNFNKIFFLLWNLLYFLYKLT